MPKETLPSKKEKKSSCDVLDHEVFRVEDSVEDFITLRMPSLTRTTMEIRYLFSDRVGGQFFRCNYWEYDSNCLVMTRKCIDSHFIRIDTRAGEKTLTDLTKTC